MSFSLTTRRLFTLLFLGVSLFLTSCETKREIVSELPEKEANEIVVFLASKGVDAEKREQTKTGGAVGGSEVMYSVIVPANQALEALAVLNRNGLPRRPGPSLLTLFEKSGFVSSAQEEQIRYQEGLSEQVAATIRKIDGVIDAVVQISFPPPEQIPGQEASGKVRASVYVKHQGILDDPNSQLVTKIKRLVAASVVGLDYNDVTVVTDRSRFTDVTLANQPYMLPEEEKEYTRVWSIVVSKESVGRFRTIFTLMSLLTLLMILMVVWLIWKVYPILQSTRGFKKLFFTFKPISLPKPPAVEVPPPPTETIVFEEEADEDREETP